MFINASNQIGGLESGVVAALTSAMFAVVSGGFACLAVVAIVAWRIPELRNHQARHAAAPFVSRLAGFQAGDARAGAVQLERQAHLSVSMTSVWPLGPARQAHLLERLAAAASSAPR